MKRRLAILALAFALLFLLIACPRQAKDDAYHWTPPEKKIAQTYDVPPYDPASGLTYEEYLTTLDVPIVIAMDRNSGTSPLWDLSRFSVNVIRNYPHVIDVSLPIYLHWLGGSIKNSTLLIGQLHTALSEEQISEGRKWQDMTECCVNRALYEKLLGSEDSEFTGLGDTTTVVERIYQRMYSTYSGGMRKEELRVSDSTELSFTVVGIVEDEEEFADTDAYGFFHIYASLEMVKTIIAKHDYTHPMMNINETYLLGRVVSSLTDSPTLFFRYNPDDPNQIQVRLEGNRILSLDEWDANFENVPVNAGYRVEITLDSGKSFAEFQRLITVENRFRTDNTARGWYMSLVNNAENQRLTNPNYKLELPQILQEVYDEDALDDWYQFAPVPRVVRPLRVAP